MKVLFITNKVKSYNLSFKNDFEPLIQLKHDIYWAANFNGFLGNKDEVPATLMDIPICSNPLKICNYKAYKVLVREIKKLGIDVIVCSTPIGGMIGRLAAKKTKTKIIYAAHGLLFFKGAPLINNTVYKLQEIIMAKWTDAIITINSEDFNAMSRIKKKKGCKLYLVHGAGVDVDKKLYSQIDIKEKRKQLGISEDSIVLLSAGFLNKNKNYRVVIKALKQLSDNVNYVVCGEGNEKDSLIKIAKKMKVENRVHFLGFRSDVLEIMKASDYVIMPSFREGVPRVVLEAMNLGIPCIGSNTRGIRELIGTEFSSFLCNPKSPKSFSEAILYAIQNPAYCKKAIERNYIESEKYTSSVVRAELLSVYRENM